MTPAWLPDPIYTDGAWDDVVSRLYAVFCNYFKKGRPRLDGLLVNWDTAISDGYEEAFWHLITGFDRQLGDRIPDYERAKLLPCCAAVIRNCGDPAIVRWVSR